MKAYISLGSNLGDRQRYIKDAVEMLGVKRLSPIIETEPIGMEGKFLNAVAEVDTELEPLVLLDVLEDIERRLGRTDKGDYKPRTIDLDILSYGDLIMDTPRLKVPHPRLKEREFLCRLLAQLEKRKGRKR